MDNAKYVIVKEGSSEIAIVFSHLLRHSIFRYEQIVAAGFVNVKSEKYKDKVVARTWGESVSLDIKSRPEDGDIIQKLLNPVYY